MSEFESNSLNPRPFADALERLRGVGLRPTRQRLALLRLLLEGGARHVTAEALHTEAMAASIKVSLATVYNNLHQFTTVDLLREVVVAPGVTYFDTNVTDHHHLYYEREGHLVDLTEDEVVLAKLPSTLRGAQVKRVDVVIRVEEVGK